MPIFKKKKDKRDSSVDSGAAAGAAAASAAPAAAAAPQVVPQAARPAPQASRPESRSAQEAVAAGHLFTCQLAHLNEPKKIKDFTSVSELYGTIAKAYGLTFDQILFCTINTPDIDFQRLLGRELGLEDHIFAHVKGKSKTVTFNKSQDSLGITIMDNGTGYAFIKGKRPNSIVSEVDGIVPGDHIESINGQSLVGFRHFDVAKCLKAIPRGTDIVMGLVEVKIGSDEDIENAKKTIRKQKKKNMATMRIKQQKPEMEEPKTHLSAEQLLEKIDDLLEAFMGIRDPELAELIISLAKGKSCVELYQNAVEEELGDFGFPDSFVLDAWNIRRGDAEIS